MLQITFTQGGEPYVFYGDDAEIRRELRKWRKSFRLSGMFRSSVGKFVFVNATPR